jgi:hypothetical protein
MDCRKLFTRSPELFSFDHGSHSGAITTTDRILSSLYFEDM